MNVVTVTNCKLTKSQVYIVFLLWMSGLLLSGCSDSNSPLVENRQSAYQGKEIYQKKVDSETFYETGQGVHTIEGKTWVIDSSTDGRNFQGTVVDPDGIVYDSKKSYQNPTFEITENASKEHYDKGRELQRKGMLKEAIVEFEEAIRITPNYAVAFDTLAWAYMGIGEMERGASYLLKNLEVNPNYAPAYTSVALIFYDKGQGDIEKTRTMLLKAKELYRNQGDKAGEQEVDDFLNKL